MTNKKAAGEPTACIHLSGVAPVLSPNVEVAPRNAERICDLAANGVVASVRPEENVEIISYTVELGLCIASAVGRSLDSLRHS